MTVKHLYEFAHLHKSSLYKSPDMANGVKERLDELQKIYDRSMARITQINRSVELTVKGKQEAFAKLKADLERELKDWSGLANGYHEQIARIEKSMHPTRHPKDDAVWELRQREIRDILRTLDPTDLEARVREAAESGNDELLQAVQYSPVPLKLATAGLLDKISQQRWEREFPEDASRLSDLRTAESEAISALGSVRSDSCTAGPRSAGRRPVEDAAA